MLTKRNTKKTGDTFETFIMIFICNTTIMLRNIKDTCETSDSQQFCDIIKHTADSWSKIICKNTAFNTVSYISSIKDNKQQLLVILIQNVHMPGLKSTKCNHVSISLHCKYRQPNQGMSYVVHTPRVRVKSCFFFFFLAYALHAKPGNSLLISHM